jgi:hypothetical protein
LDQAAIFIYRDRKIRRSKTGCAVTCIFEWFAEDFQVRDDAPAIFRSTRTGYEAFGAYRQGRRWPDAVAKDAAGPLSWIYRYANEQDRVFLASTDYRVVYLYYDWGLNEQR